MIGGRHEVAQLSQCGEEVSGAAVGGYVCVGDVGLLYGPPDDPFVCENVGTWGNGMLHPIHIHPKFGGKEPLHVVRQVKLHVQRMIKG